MKSLQLSQIWIYPVKSMGGISVTSSCVRAKGLEYDRRWMLIDDQGVAMTQRTDPKMALFKPIIQQDRMTIAFEGNTLDVPLITKTKTITPARVWDDGVATVEVSEHHSAWISARLGVTCKLVFFPEENPRPVDAAFRINDEHVSLADAYPILIIGQSSLDDLNLKLDQPVPMDRFRPNLVFTGGEPYEEDAWKRFTVGTNRFSGVKPCARCMVPTIDQQKGEKGIEPLRTLSTYRKRENKTYFGQNVLPIDQAKIHIGDSIFVEEHIAVSISQSY